MWRGTCFPRHYHPFDRVALSLSPVFCHNARIKQAIISGRQICEVEICRFGEPYAPRKFLRPRRTRRHVRL